MNLPDLLHSDEYGEIFVKGHRITLFHVLSVYRSVQSAAAVVAAFPTLPLSLVEKIIAFCAKNEPAVETYLEETKTEIERQQALPVRGPSAAELEARLDAHRHSQSA